MSDRPVPSIQLRPVSTADLPILFVQQSDPEATAMADFPAREEADFMAHWAKILDHDAVTARTIVAGGEVAGNLVSWTDDIGRNVGYWLGREFWGRGIATRALAVFLREETTRPLNAHVARHNVASRRVLAKCGFLETGEDAEGVVLRLDV